jgi:5-methylcytosine-specific restriction endonuclease McrA
MRHIDIPQPVTFPKRWEKISERRLLELATKTTQTERSIYFRKKNSWTKLKKWLAEFSNNKCWYCEASSLRAPLDVDHFRPKLAVTIDRASLIGFNGYYWLAYEWWNFRLTCQRCNRPEDDESDYLRGKANEFPLQDDSRRCNDTSRDITQEIPKLLDPCVKGDIELLAHGLDGEVKPSASAGSWEYDRARYTIDTLGFNSYNVPEHKRESWQTLLTLIKSVSWGFPSSEVTPLLQQYIAPEHEYASFFRSVIGTHRDKDWIEEIL